MAIGPPTWRTRGERAADMANGADHTPGASDKAPNPGTPPTMKLSMAKGRRRRARGEERGSVTAELVIATPLLLLLVLGIVQFALWEHAAHVAQATAQQGLAVGRVQGGSDQAATAEAKSVLAQLGSGVLVHPAVTATRGAATTTVVVSGQAEGILPFLSLPVHAVATGPTERFTVTSQGGGP